MHHKGIYSTGLNLCVYQSKYLYMLTVRDRAVTPRLGCRLTGVGGEDGGEKNTVQEMMAFLEKSIVIYFAGGISPTAPNIYTKQTNINKYLHSTQKLAY